MARTSRYIVPPGMKRCPKCKQVKPRKAFNGGYCSDCYRDYHRTWTAENRYDIVERMRLAAIQAYGGACRDCGLTDPQLLAVYPRVKGGTRVMVYQLRDQHYPAGYYLLCANCAIKAKQDLDNG